ncbi:MAG: NTP transferase domain-containing protein [Pseudomonadales bacterium]
MPADPVARGGALILAAGFARRFGSDKRRHVLADGTPLLTATVRRYAQVFDRIAVVIREGEDELAAELGAIHPGVRIVTAADAALGMGHSLAAGVRAVAGDWSWVAVALGDMPWIRAATLTSLAHVFTASGSTGILQPRSGNRSGHPVLFGADCFDELLRLTGDTGARAVLERHRDSVRHLDVDDPGIFADMDRPG